MATQITISGNWRDGGPEREWAGSGLVQNGRIECSAELGDDTYEQIEDQIADGDTEGIVIVQNADLGRDVTYYWSAE